MKCDKKDMLLYAVTDRSWLHGDTVVHQVELALKGGATFIQLREKTLDEETFLKEAKEIAALCKSYGVPFVINDNVKIAKESGADGVHVGQDDMEAGNVREILGPDMIIGVSAHNVEEARLAVERGADYLGCGAMFGSATKTNVSVCKYETLKAITEAVDIPVVAIGGINESNIEKLTGSGCDGVAVISALFAKDDITAAAKNLRALSEKMVKG